MKTKIFLGLIGALAVLTGCVGTVSGEKTGAVPFVKDSFEGRYPRSVDEVFAASKGVVAEMGVLDKHGTLEAQTNAVRYVEGKINQRRIWIRVEAIEPKVTAVTVQVRTSGGGTDMDLTHQIDKNIMLRLLH